MGLFGGSEERTAQKNVIANLEAEITQAEAGLAGNQIAADEARAAIRATIAPKWEYFSIDDADSAKLDEIGHFGWEMVSAVSFTTGFGLGGNNSMTVHMRYVFKRPFSEEYPASAQSYLENVAGWKQRKADLESQLAVARADLAGI